MFNNKLFDSLLSLILIYSLLSILVSIINEMINYYFKRRQKVLKESILKLLNDNYNISFGHIFYHHANIQAITKFKGRRKWAGLSHGSMKKVFPSYISSEMFASTLVDVIAGESARLRVVTPERDDKGNVMLDGTGRKIYRQAGDELPDDLLSKFRSGLQVMNPSPLRDTLKGFYDRAGGDLDKINAQIERWFNDYQDRVSGWYKVTQKNNTILLGFLVAVLLNVDSLHILHVLTLDDKLRNNLVAVSEQVADNYSKLSDSLKTDADAMLLTFSKVDRRERRQCENRHQHPRCEGLRPVPQHYPCVAEK
jgi:hypothetical protein